MSPGLRPAAAAARAPLLVAALAWPGASAQAAAEPSPEPPAAGRALSLAEAVALAAESNPSLGAARQRAAAASAEARAAERGVSWPRLGFSSGWTATDTPASVFAQKLNAGLFTSEDFAIHRLNSPEARAHLSSALALEVPLDLFGKASPAAAAARDGADAAAQGAQEVELDVRLRVAQAWHRAAVAVHAVGATERAAAAAAAREAQIEAQAAEGRALRAELLRARARRRSLEAELAARHGEAQTAAAGLALAIGVPGPVVPALEAKPEPAAPAGEAAPPPESAVLGELGEWLERAAGRPAVAAARAALHAAEQGLVEAARADRPDLALAAQLQDDRGPLSEGQSSATAGVSLRWSLFDPRRGSRRAAAESARAAAAADLAAAEAQARFEIESAWHGAVAAQRRSLAARGGTEEGREALRVTRERRAAGVATLTDELETEAAALAAELAELTADAEAAVARAALERAAGVSFLALERVP